MIVLLGLWHGLCALPVILSFIGAEPFESAYERKEVADRVNSTREDGEKMNQLEENTPQFMEK